MLTWTALLHVVGVLVFVRVFVRMLMMLVLHGRLAAVLVLTHTWAVRTVRPVRTAFALLLVSIMAVAMPVTVFVSMPVPMLVAVIVCCCRLRLRPLFFERVGQRAPRSLALCILLVCQKARPQRFFDHCYVHMLSNHHQLLLSIAMWLVP